MEQETPLTAYVEKNLTKVDGWAGTPESLLLLPQLLDVQQGCNDLGAFEIGVHHGRYLIALHNACRPQTRSMGLDLFEDQSKNVDGSGSGNIGQAQDNVTAYAREPELVELRAGDSLTLTDQHFDSILDDYKAFRITSVDGGHTPTHAAEDIRTAARLTAPGGFISVDDFFHTNFPGVTEGVYATLAGNQTPFIPWFVTRKKLFLAHVSYVDSYTRAIREGLSEYSLKNVTIAGHPCVSLYI